MSLDSSIFNFFYDLAGRYSLLGWLFSFLSENLIYILAVIFLIFLFSSRITWRKRLYLFFLGTLSVVVSRGLITEIIHFLYYRARPFVELGLPSTDYAATSSLSSGHMAFIVPLSLLVWHEDKSLGKWFIAGSILIGLGRIATGYHWPTDILLGILVGTASFYLVRKFLPKA